MIGKSLLWGYAGAVVAGLVVSIVGYAADLSSARVAAIAPHIGIAGGALGLALPWLRRRRIGGGR